jgi:radical SAM protein with 4Fe4S-binding SPASM domain
MFNWFTKTGDTSLPDLVMEPSLAAAYDATRKEGGTQPFCYAPSVNMYFSQTGEVKVCCHNSEFTIGKYPEQSMQEIWNSDKANELRQHMRNYDLSHGCAVCEFDVKLRAFDQVQARHFDPRPRHASYPTMMEFLISNKCNLECVMCSGEYSNLIRKNRDHLPPLPFPYDSAFLKQLEEFIPHLHEARFSGSGEAFLIDMNYDIWEMIIRLNPKCVMTIQTNGTVLTDRAKDILRRGNFQIGVSLDSLKKETYEAVRLNAKFEKVIENVEYFSNYCTESNNYFMLALCVMRDNWHELPAFVTYCNKMKAAMVLHKVWSPDEYALHNLPATRLKEIYNQLCGFTYTPEDPLQKQNLKHYNYFVEVIKKWMEEADEKEKNLSAINNLSADQLAVVVSKKIKNHFAGLKISEDEKLLQFEKYELKVQSILNGFSEQSDRTQLLQMIYLQEPEGLIHSMLHMPYETLYTEAKKFLETGKVKA